MSHNINTYIGRKPAWHELGTVTGEYSTWQQILEHGGLDFDVFKSQLHDGLGRLVNAWGIFRWNQADKAVGLKDAAVFLGTVGKDYTPIQHAVGFNMIDALVASKTGAHYETAGVLGEGEVVWGLADLGLTASVGDDKQTGYLLFSTSHDGTMPYSLRTCMTRVVCQNTLTVALSEKTRASFKIRHSRQAENRIKDAHVVIANMGDDVQRIEEKLNMLAKREMTRESTKDIFDRLFPRKSDEKGVPVDTTRRDNIIGDILRLYEANDNDTFPEQRGTAYNLLNAITNYADHERSSKLDRRAESALFGSGDALKSKALDLILDAADDLPVTRGSVLYSMPETADVVSELLVPVTV